MVSALDDGDGVDLDVSKSLDGLGDTFFACRQFPSTIKALAL
jgi:hypothetical protein